MRSVHPIHRCLRSAAIALGGMLAAATVASAQTAATGACCVQFPDGSTACVQASADRCAFIGGDYHGDGTTCDADSCPPAPTGACCIDSPFTGPACLELTEAQCTAFGGTYAGDGVACADAGCVTTSCPCDQDGDGDGDVLDILSFLNGFFHGDADYNGDGATDVHDLLDFLNCIFNDCN